MYSAKLKSKKDFIVKASTLDFSYIMDRDKELGTTPVGHLVVALGGCALMCVRGYYIRQGIKDLLIETEVEYEKEFTVKININKEVLEEEKPAIIEYIHKYCTVSQLLTKEVAINFEIIGK